MRYRTGFEDIKNAKICDTTLPSFYKNPNECNDLSMMNISHLSNGFKSSSGNVQPGMYVEGAEAFRMFAYITNEEH